MTDTQQKITWNSYTNSTVSTDYCLLISDRLLALKWHTAMGKSLQFRPEMFTNICLNILHVAQPIANTTSVIRTLHRYSHTFCKTHKSNRNTYDMNLNARVVKFLCTHANWGNIRCACLWSFRCGLHMPENVWWLHDSAQCFCAVSHAYVENINFNNECVTPAPTESVRNHQRIVSHTLSVRIIFRNSFYKH